MKREVKIVDSAVIRLAGVGKSFKSRGNRNPITGIWRPDWVHKTALDNLDFIIERGESVAFLGPNGAGKTTTTKMMTGLIKPTAGTIEVLGEDPFNKRPDFLKRIGLVMGNRAGLNWDLTARQAFDMLAVIYDLDRDAAETRVLELTELLDCSKQLDTQVRRLSLGERMKMEAIGSILHEPEVLFLDEPTIGLDIHSKAALREFLRHINSQGVTLVLTSHDMDDVEEVCNRAIVISEGKKIFDDSLQQLNADYSDFKYISITTEEAIAKDRLQKIGEVIVSDGQQFIKVKRSDLGHALEQLAKFDLHDLSIESVPLERIMRDLLERGTAVEGVS